MKETGGHSPSAVFIIVFFFLVMLQWSPKEEATKDKKITAIGGEGRGGEGQTPLPRSKVMKKLFSLGFLCIRSFLLFPHDLSFTGENR